MHTERRPILVVGSINMDLVVGTARLPAIGETISGSVFNTHCGGKGANQAVAVARLGYPVGMVGKVGADSFGVQLRQNLEDAGVDCAAVETVPGSSGVAVIMVSPRGDSSIVVVAGANDLLSPEDIDAQVDRIRSSGMVLAQLETPTLTIERLAMVCEREGVPLVLDPAPARPLSDSLFRRVGWLTPNETEAAFYGHAEGGDAGEIEATMTSLLALGPSGIVLKMGERGALLGDASGWREYVAAVPVQAVDTTAAGDAFNGAFATALMLGKTPRESGKFAAAAAALCVTRHGAQAAMPTLAEVEALLVSAQMEESGEPREEA